MSKSENLYSAARELIPGGVNSPVRAFTGVGGTPLFIERADGAYLYDVDGKAYIDYVGSWGPMVLGHNHPAIRNAVIEAATIDGATPWRRFWTIVFPLLSPVTFFLLVMNVIYAFFDTFAIVDAATHGGPGKDTAILVYRVYYDGFKALDMGGSAAQSVVLMAIVIVLTVFQFRFVEKKVQY